MYFCGNLFDAEKIFSGTVAILAVMCYTNKKVRGNPQNGIRIDYDTVYYYTPNFLACQAFFGDFLKKPYLPENEYGYFLFCTKIRA